MDGAMTAAFISVTDGGYALDTIPILALVRQMSAHLRSNGYGAQEPMISSTHPITKETTIMIAKEPTIAIKE